MAIPERLTISGTELLQEKRLCDARPVYGVALKNETDGTAVSKVFLYFRAHQSEWWLGPEVGGTEFVARATGSLFQVIPRIEELQWRVQIQAGIENDEVEWHDSEVQLDNTAEIGKTTPWSLLCSFVMATSGLLLWSFCGSLGGGKKGATRWATKKLTSRLGGRNWRIGRLYLSYDPPCPPLWFWLTIEAQ